MRCLTLTGGIGSGKSYVSHIFAALGVSVYEADGKTKSLYEKDLTLQSAIIELLGRDIYQDGVLSKEAMATKIFSDKNLLMKINDLVHPAVIRDFTHWKAQQKGPYVILESAIILETPFASVADRTATVSTPMEVRIARLRHRDPEAAKDAQRRIEKQWSDPMRESRADFIIHSDGKTPLIPQVLAIHHTMLSLCKGVLHTPTSSH